MSFRAPALIAFACLGCFASACSPEVTVSTHPSTEPKPVPWEPSKPETSSIQCDPASAADPSRTILAFADGSDLVFESASGVRKVVHTFSTGPSSGIQVAARDGFVAAIASSVSAEGTPTGEAILLTRDGALVWSTSADKSFDSIQLGEGGAVAIGSWDSTLVVSPDGEVTTVDGIAPAGPPDAEGRFAVTMTTNPYLVEFGFFDPQKGVTPLSESAASGSATVVKNAIEYLSADEAGNLTLIRETPDSIASIALPASAVAPDSYLVSATDTGLGLVRSSKWTDAGAMVNHDFVADANTGSFAAITPAPGVVTFGAAFYGGAMLGDGGEALLVARNASTGGVFRSLDHGASWERLGESFTNVTDIYVTRKSGTYVVVGTDVLGYFPIGPWSKGSADIDGVGAFVVRPSDGVLRTIPALSAQVSLTEDGSCVAFVADGSIGVVDVHSGATMDLGPIADIATPVWVE